MQPIPAVLEITTMGALSMEKARSSAAESRNEWTRERAHGTPRRICNEQ
jgi:hypothetical protein